jgi:hypothetical protein
VGSPRRRPCTLDALTWYDAEPLRAWLRARAASGEGGTASRGCR